MRRSLLLILFFIFTLSLQAQKDTLNVIAGSVENRYASKASDLNISIYPVPVRENFFTIRTELEVSFIKITNIIGQDIYRAQYNNPQTLNKIILDNPRRGMYLVTILFSDGTRAVKKIMIEESE